MSKKARKGSMFGVNQVDKGVGKGNQEVSGAKVNDPVKPSNKKLIEENIKIMKTSRCWIVL